MGEGRLVWEGCEVVLTSGGMVVDTRLCAELISHPGGLVEYIVVPTCPSLRVPKEQNHTQEKESRTHLRHRFSASQRPANPSPFFLD